MSSDQIMTAVMFADVAGSTRLYEQLGDSLAQESISLCLARMSEISNRYGGVVVKTIGDELMCRFPGANEAVKAACNIHEVLEGDTTIGGVKLSVRIGLQYGPAILEDGDVFGDAVNVAARMAGIAKAQQIITTEDTVSNLSPENAEIARRFDVASVKGKQDEIVIYEVLWEQDDVTRMTGVNFSFGSQTQKLRLSIGGTVKELGADNSAALLGRGSQCDLIINGNLTSRIHARIEQRRGKFILIDQSTNGTFVKPDDGDEVYLRREELPLVGSGMISLGERVERNTANLLSYIIY